MTLHTPRFSRPPLLAIEEIIVEVKGVGPRVSRYIVTCGAYRAELPACPRDECASGDIAGALKECAIKLDHRHQHPVGGKTSVDAWLRHERTNCHGYHRGRVQALAELVTRTYGSFRPLTRAKTMGAAPVGGRPETIAALLGWTVDDVVAELAKASS